MKIFSLFITCCLAGWVQSPAQVAEEVQFAQPTPMANDRADDSYVIYSQLLRSGPIEWRDVSRKQWLIEDTTAAAGLNVPCPQASIIGMNPHTAVQAPKERQTEWDQVLADYDGHCHDVIRLEGEKFKEELPVHPLDAADRRMYAKDTAHPPATFADAAGLHQFSEVFFNGSHTLALVEQGMFCGGLCGNWTWVVLTRTKDQWEVLPWVRETTFS